MAQRGGATFECPNCGAEVRQGARSCPECGADDETGWSEDTMYDGLDLPDPGYGKESMDERSVPRKKGPPVARIAMTVLLLLLAVAGWKLILYVLMK